MAEFEAVHVTAPAALAVRCGDGTVPIEVEFEDPEGPRLLARLDLAWRLIERCTRRRRDC